MSLAEGGQHALLTGHGRVESQDLRITADSIELFGKDFVYASCHGNVHVVDARRGLDLTSQDLFYDRDRKIARIRGNAIMADVKNEMVVKGGFIEDNDKEQITIVQIGVRIFKKDIVCRAEFARYQRDKKILELSGMPWVSKGGDVYQAARITVNLDTEEISLEGSVQGTLVDKGKKTTDSTGASGRTAAGLLGPAPSPLDRSRRRPGTVPPPRLRTRPRRPTRPCPRDPPVDNNGTLFLEGLAKSFGRVPAVREVTFRMESGEVVGLLGPNGAGKTTVFYMVVGFIRPTSGRIWLNGQDVTGFPMYRRARLGVSYLPQEPSVFRKLSVEDNVLAILETRRNLSARERHVVLDRLLDDLGITQSSKAEGLHAVRRREKTHGDRPVPRHRAEVPPPGRAFRRHRPHHRLRAQVDRPGAFRARDRGPDHRPQRPRHAADHPPFAHHQQGRDPGQRHPGRAPGKRGCPVDLPGTRVRDLGRTARSANAAGYRGRRGRGRRREGRRYRLRQRGTSSKI